MAVEDVMDRDRRSPDRLEHGASQYSGVIGVSQRHGITWYVSKLRKEEKESRACAVLVGLQ